MTLPTEPSRARARAFLETRIEWNRPAVAQASRTAGDAAERLRAWRKEAGPKSRWSAHARMHEARLHSDLVCIMDEIGNLARAMTPGHWQLGTWHCPPARGGDRARWAARNGRATGGVGFSLHAEHIAEFLGSLLGIGARARVILRADRAQLTGLGVTPGGGADLSFEFQGHIRREASGRTPQDAWCRLAATGEVLFFNLCKSGSGTGDTGQIFADTARRTFDAMVMESNWNVVPHLWKSFFAHPAIRALRGRGPAARRASFNTSWNAVKRQRLERILATGLAIAESVPSRGRMSRFILLSGTRAEPKTCRGWCGNSAALAYIAAELAEGRIPDRMEEWTIFPVEAEAGAEMRRLAAQVCAAGRSDHGPERDAEAG